MRRPTLILPVVAALILVSLVGWYLVHTDRVAVEGVRADFSDRAALSGELVNTLIDGSSRQNTGAAEQLYSGDARSVQAAIAADPAAAISIVMTLDGTVLGARPDDLRSPLGKALVAPIAKLAFDRSAMVFSDLIEYGEQQLFVYGIPFSAAGERRVSISSVPLETIDNFARGNLVSSLGTGGKRGYVIDANGLIIATSGAEELGVPLPDEGLAATLRLAGSGTFGQSYYTSAGVPGTGWRVVFIAPERVLLQPIRVTRNLAWQIFVGFALATACMVALGAIALTRSARLAHERLHDTLTGLPNRTLFFDQAQRSLAAARRSGDQAAVLFIDLDGFKPINDSHGHAAGDAVLDVVGQRLRGAVRGDDIVSRFGGDEFLVLCVGNSAAQLAVGIAERLQGMIAEPVEIDGHAVHVGSSIGVAVQVEVTEEVASLIHQADLAMYEAKKAGRGCVKVFGQPGAAEVLVG